MTEVNPQEPEVVTTKLPTELAGPNSTSEPHTAELDPTSLSLTDQPLTDQDTLSDSEIAFVLPWSYFPGSGDNSNHHGPIELAFTRNPDGDLTRLQPIINEATDLNVDANLAKRLLIMTPDGILNRPISELIGTATNREAALIAELNRLEATSAFVQNEAYNADLENPVIGFNNMGGYSMTLMVVTDNQGDQSVYLMSIDAGESDPNLNPNESSTTLEQADNLMRDYQGNVPDIVNQVETKTQETVHYIFFGDPGHGLRWEQENEDGSSTTMTLSLLQETEAHHVIGKFLD